MRKFLFGVVVCLAVVFVVRSCQKEREKDAAIKAETALIRNQLDQVAKLLVTEGHYSEVYSYEDSRELLGSLITADKKALVVVNAEANIVFDLNALEYHLDTLNKKIRILRIPEAELKLFPDLKYYDIQADYLNPFEARDYNRISQQVKERLRARISNSGLMEDAQNRLFSELSKLYILSGQMGWTLVLEGAEQQEFQQRLEQQDSIFMLKPLQD